MADIEVSRKARKHVSVLVARLRQASAMLARRAQPGVRMVSLSYMPEYALVYLLHVLSADVDPGDSDALRRAARHIQAFMGPFPSATPVCVVPASDDPSSLVQTVC